MTQTKKTQKKPKTGAGRPVTLKGARPSQVNLDEETREIMLDLGGGSLSRGIRLSGKIARLDIGDLYSEFSKSISDAANTDYRRGVKDFATFVMEKRSEIS